MSIFQVVFLGILQGLTEFFPVSSSGHLTLAQEWLGLQQYADMHLFLEAINFGTLLALIVFFWPRLTQICHDVFIEHDLKLVVNIILIGDLVDSSPFFGSLITVSFTLLIVGIIMVLTDKLPHLSRLENEEKLSKRRALYIGLAQILAFIPGVSRSGSTIIAGRLVGLNNKSAATYSFLVSIPIMFGVLCKMLISHSSQLFLLGNLPILLLSNFCAFLAGIFAIRIAFRIYERRDALQIFGWYRIVLACLILIIVLLQI